MKEQSIDSLDLRRRVQAYYLSYGVYIPLDDILGAPNEPVSSSGHFDRNECHANGLRVWVPLRIKLPLLGEKVYEWCLTKS